MSWYCLTSGDERSAIKIEGYARNDDAREALSKLRGASYFMRRTFTPNSSLDLGVELNASYLENAILVPGLENMTLVSSFRAQPRNLCCIPLKNSLDIPIHETPYFQGNTD